MGLFSKDGVFFDLLEQQAATAHRAAEAFMTLTADFGHLAEHIETIDRIESDGDTLTHQLANRVDSTFVTPLDKEDLHALSGELDNITDNIDACTARIGIYQLLEPREDLVNFVRILVEVTATTVKAVHCLRDLKARDRIHETLVRIHEIENEADEAFRTALGHLFNAPDANPILVIKWKEIYDRIERAVDNCEDVANMVESVVVKYA
ncbi:MAG TPA: DUF47 family protein [Armatimonadota bacterium]